MPQLIRRISEMRKLPRAGVVGFVPTMGALHAGHSALMDAARRESDLVVVSIFVNPIQFDNKDDYEKYGRNLPADLELSARHGVDFVFAPSAEEMYQGGEAVFVEVPEVSKGLCGAFRPGHFRGVATVVTKLFNIVQPRIAYFGEKDAQQLAVIRAMTAGLNLPIRIVGVPTVRETDGLAMSSRNARLTAGERACAPLIFKALQAARHCIENGARDAAEVRACGLALLAAEPRMRVEYFEIVNAETIQPVHAIAGPVLVAAAVWLGAVRLIDNVPCRPTASAPPVLQAP